MDTLSELENNSIFIIREAYRACPKVFALWSMGKDSSVLLWLIRKAFFGKVPFPIVHIDTTFKIKGMIDYRNALAKEWKLDFRYAINEDAIREKSTFLDGNIDRITCCGKLKTKPLVDFQSGVGYQFKFNYTDGSFSKIAAEKFNAVFVGLRSDEEGSRSKERYFSIRNSSSTWDISNQAPEFWNYYNLDLPEGAHIRISPLLEWNELDIWRYIEREGIPIIDLYFSNQEGKRYRSLGCACCTNSISSSAKCVTDIVEELSVGSLKGIAERSGRAQDDEGGGTLEALRKKGYM